MDSLEKIKADVYNCRRCPLYRTRIMSVPGEGSLNAKIMFIGEAPGASEDKAGRPFCGRAGKILDELLGGVGIRREEIFIGNILKCRPPNNRNPMADEIKACTPYLKRQIEIIKPKIICTLGNYARTFIFKEFGLNKKIQGISRIHGKVFEADLSYERIKIIPLYHPAVAVYNINMKKILKADFLKIRNLLNNVFPSRRGSSALGRRWTI